MAGTFTSGSNEKNAPNDASVSNHATAYSDSSEACKELITKISAPHSSRKSTDLPKDLTLQVMSLPDVQISRNLMSKEFREFLDLEEPVLDSPDFWYVIRPEIGHVVASI